MPFSDSPPRLDASAPFAVPETPAFKPRILLVDDDRDTAWVAARALSADYEVIVAFDGHDGFALATGRPAPDLIITDVEMPGLDGLSMIRKIRKHGELRAIPILVLSAHGEPADVFGAIRVGARHHLTKPFRLDDLLTRVRSLLRHHRVLWRHDAARAA
jgi:DNA-binding response OmpR family regulator